MPAARPAWKGQLRLSLVTIGIELFTAIKPGGKATFHQIHKPTGKRIHSSKVAPTRPYTTTKRTAPSATRCITAPSKAQARSDRPATARKPFTFHETSFMSAL